VFTATSTVIFGHDTTDGPTVDPTTTLISRNCAHRNRSTIIVYNEHSWLIISLLHCRNFPFSIRIYYLLRRKVINDKCYQNNNRFYCLNARGDGCLVIGLYGNRISWDEILYSDALKCVFRDLGDDYSIGVTPLTIQLIICEFQFVLVDSNQVN